MCNVGQHMHGILLTSRWQHTGLENYVDCNALSCLLSVCSFWAVPSSAAVAHFKQVVFVLVGALMRALAFECKIIISGFVVVLGFALDQMS